MGSASSRPAAAAALPTPLPTLTIRNLTITSLELKLVERLHAQTQLDKPSGSVRATSHAPSRRASYDSPATSQDDARPSSAKQDLKDLTIRPFSECRTPVYPPDLARHERLRLTFEDPDTKHRYVAEIPASSQGSIVLTSHHNGADEETKEFTAIYLPQHSYLALFSSANLSTWMSTLDPSTTLSSLSIPGTHNSPTCHVALPSVRCQAVPVLEQLNNGVRFLDVRVSCPPFSDSTTPELALVHSAFPVSLTGPKYLSGLLATLYAFLDAHPTETILVSLKREGTGRGTDADLSQILDRYYFTPQTPQTPPPAQQQHDQQPQQQERERWYLSPAIPTLSQSRNRLVLVRRFRLAPTIPPSRGGIDGSVWPDNVSDGTCGSGAIRIQDYYGVDTPVEIERKVRYAQEGLQRAAADAAAAAAAANANAVVGAAATGGGGQGVEGGEGCGGQQAAAPLFINFLSASNFFNASCWPDRIAVKINPSMIEYLCMGHGAPDNGSEQPDHRTAATGIVVTDWVGHRGDWDLIRCIVGWNARLQLRQ